MSPGLHELWTSWTTWTILILNSYLMDQNAIRPDRIPGPACFVTLTWPLLPRFQFPTMRGEQHIRAGVGLSSATS